MRAHTCATLPRSHPGSCPTCWHASPSSSSWRTRATTSPWSCAAARSWCSARCAQEPAGGAFAAGAACAAAGHARLALPQPFSAHALDTSLVTRHLTCTCPSLRLVHAADVSTRPHAACARVTSLCFAPTSVAGDQLLSGHEDGSVRAWDCSKGMCARAHRKKGPEVSAVLVLDRRVQFWALPCLGPAGPAGPALGSTRHTGVTCQCCHGILAPHRPRAQAAGRGSAGQRQGGAAAVGVHGVLQACEVGACGAACAGEAGGWG